MRLSLLVAFCFTIWCGLIYAQKLPADSLLKLVAKSKIDTSAVQLYLSIGKTYENNAPKKARTYYLKAAVLSEKLKYNAGMMKYYFYYSNTFMVEGKLDSLLYYNQKALAFAKKVNDPVSIGLALFNVGIAYREMSDFEKAIAYCLEGRAILEKKGERKVQMQIDDALTVLYSNRLEYAKAIVFGERAVAQAIKYNAREVLPSYWLNLSVAYFGAGESQKAENLIKKVLSLAIENKDIRIQAVATQNLAGINLKNRKYAQVKIYALRSLELYKEIGSLDGEASVLKDLAISYLQTKELVKAKTYAEKSLAICRNNNLKREEALVLNVLSNISYAMNDMTSAIKYDTESFATIETMVTEVISQNSANLEKKYETEKKNVKIRLQEATIRQKNTLNYILIGSAVALLIIILLGYKNYAHKQKLQQAKIAELETEKQLAATEAVLKGEEQERTRLAKDLHDGLGGMLSGLKHSFGYMQGNLVMTPENAMAFNRSMDMLDSSIKEMRRVAHNMMPEALVKFGLDTALRDFCADINLTGALQVDYQSIGMETTVLDNTTAITIFRIVQELLNNTMKHASANTAIVQLAKIAQNVSITVEDNGIGFNSELLNQVEGIGWNNIKNRVEFLKGKWDIQSASNSGTSVHIEFKI